MFIYDRLFNQVYVTIYLHINLFKILA